MRAYSFTVPTEYEGAMVKTYLTRALSFSTRTITALKHHPRGILLGGAHARTVDILRAGDTLTLTLVESEDAEHPLLPSRLKVDILYEDADLLIYNKPPFMPCHTSCGHAQDTLENVYATHCLRQGLYPRLRALNRLDRDTSGCVLVAKNQFIASRLTGRFEKDYRAILTGILPGDGRAEGRIWRPDPVDMRRVVDARGQVAITDYGILRRGRDHTYVQLHLLTGRTHQIRVHMAHLGYPVLGDPLYGEPSALIARQALHCFRMRLTQPITGEAVRVEAPLPADMRQAYDSLFDEGGHPPESGGA